MWCLVSVPPMDESHLVVCVRFVYPHDTKECGELSSPHVGSDVGIFRVGCWRIRVNTQPETGLGAAPQAVASAVCDTRERYVARSIRAILPV